MRFLLLMLILSVLLALFSSPVQAGEPPFPVGPQTFDFKDPKNTNAVAITIDAPLEPIVGFADGVSGTATFDPNDPKATTGTISVAVSSLRFPNEGYTQTARFYALQEEKYPSVTCVLKKIKRGKVVSRGVFSGTVDVDFTCCGVTKTLTVPLTVTYLPDIARQRGPDFDGDVIHIRCDFSIKRSDFGIAPDVVPVLVSPEIGVRVSLVGIANRKGKTPPTPKTKTGTDTTATAPETISIRHDGVTTPLAERMAYYKVTGLSVAVIKNFEVAWVGHWGKAAENRPVTATTLYPIGAMAQPLLTAAVLSAAENQEIDLDADINTYLKTWKVASVDGARRPLTVRDLLRHTSGLTYHKYQGYPADAAAPTLLQVLKGHPPATTPEVRPATAPGTTFALAMENYTVLQQIAEDRSGEDFNSVMQRLLFEPLRLSDSRFAAFPPATWRDRAAVGHDADGRPLPGNWRLYPEVAASGFWTTPGDFASALAELLRCMAGKGTYLKAESARLLREEIPETGKTRQTMAFGITGQNEDLRLFKGGNPSGFFCHLDADPQRGNATIVFANSDLCWRLTNEVRDALHMP